MMKTFLVTLFMCCSLYGFSQKRSNQNADRENFFRIGAKAGVNINKITGQSYKEGFNYNYLLGGFMQFNFSKTFGLQPEVNFVQSSSEFTNGASDVYDDLFRDGSQRKARLNYIKVPLLLNINVGSSKRVKLQLGPQIGGIINQSIDELRNDRDIFKKSDWSAVGGLWIQLPLINIGGRYEVGLSNLNDIDNTEKWKSQAFTIFAGITF